MGRQTDDGQRDRGTEGAERKKGLYIERGIEGQLDKRTNRYTNNYRGSHMDGGIGIWMDRQTNGQTNKEMD